MLIRKMKEGDASILAQIWLDASLKAHDFIPASHWESHVLDMETIYLPQSEVYVAEDQNHILGFVALVANHLAAIFVDPNLQGKGIGSLLLSQAQDMRSSLTLNVYQKNEISVQFYLAKDFKIVNTSIDPLTGEKEYVMQWNK